MGCQLCAILSSVMNLQRPAPSSRDMTHPCVLRLHMVHTPIQLSQRSWLSDRIGCQYRRANVQVTLIVLDYGRKGRSSDAGNLDALKRSHERSTVRYSESETTFT